jgi:hypothetical protein
MALQLVYTSAPRLLEAGRTGFGTVARHRAAGGLLMAAVERVSQFGRSAGQNPRRVVFSHRILHAGASSHHVFSCIRDAGSDYTGRTSHLAHHLIADAREARAAAEAGLTPADILRQMRWRSSWNEAPRFFEPEEEVSLTSFRPMRAPGAWERLTRNAAHALLPGQSQRCLLLLPGEEGALDLFSESLATLAELPAWLVTFTTHVEPADDLADIRWIALAHDSPLRPQVESASRTSFDLTMPGSLPVPRAAEARLAPSAALTAPVSPPLPAVRLDEPRATVPLPSLFAEPAPLGRRSPWPYVLAAVLLAAVGTASFLLFPRLPGLLSVRRTGAESAIDLARSIDELWQKHRLNLPDTRNWLKSQADPSLVEAHRQTLGQILAAIREPLRPQEVRMPEHTQNDFVDLVTHFRAWQQRVQQGVRDPQWSGEDPNAVQAAALVAISRLKDDWARVTQAVQGVPEMPDVLQTEIHARVVSHLSGGSAPGQGRPGQWLELLRLTRTPDSPALAWTSCWELAVKPVELLTAADRQALGEASMLADMPAWLREQIRRQLLPAGVEKAPMTVVGPKASEMPSATPAAPAVPADGPGSAHPRFMVIETSLLPLAQALEQLPTLPLEPDMQVFTGSVREAESGLTLLRQLGAAGVYRKSFNDQQTLEFRQRRLVRLPDATAASRIIGRSADGARVLFEVIVLPRAADLVDAWPSSPAYTFASEVQKTSTFLDASATRWLGSLVIVGSPPLRLQQVDDPARRYRLKNDGRRFLVEADLPSTSDSAARARLASVDQELESLRQGIRFDEQRRAELAASNLGRVMKEEQSRRLDESLAIRQQRLLQLEEDRKRLVPDSPQFLGLPKGAYSLFAGLRRLCEIRIEAPP